VNRFLLVIVGCVVVLIVAGLLAGSILDSKGVHERANPLGKDITSSQYDALKQGDAERDVVDGIHQSGLPESHVQAAYRQLFPAHSAAVSCSYWYVKDRDGVVARLCFTSPGGLLRQKLLRTVPRA
jgi:hypothetical protein